MAGYQSKLLKTSIYLVAMFCFSAIPVSAQLIFSGTVKDEKGSPLQAVTLSIGKAPVASSDSTGAFHFTGTTEKVTISFSHVGFRQYTAVCKTGEEITVTLLPVEV